MISALTSVVVGQYRFGPLIAESDRSVVYRAAVDGLDDAWVAIKVAKRVEADPAASVLIARALAVNRIRHENIGGCVNVIDVNGHVGVVMELLDGDRLDRALERGRLPVERAAMIGAQIASAIAAAHRAGFTHGALHPAKIMLVRRGGSDDFVSMLPFGVRAVGTATSVDAHALRVLLHALVCPMPALLREVVVRTRTTDQIAALADELRAVRG